MIKGLMQPITVEMVIQEVNRYADSEFRYADKSDEVAIANAVRRCSGWKRRSGGIWRGRGEQKRISQLLEERPVFGDLLEIKLAKAKVTLWRFVSSIDGGDEWRSAIDSGISDAGVVILALSRAACSSQYVTYEWASAMGMGKPILLCC